jgi:hypothetical protein
MVDWVENGTAANHLVATKYNFSQDELFVDLGYTRKLCPVSHICSLPKSKLTLRHFSSIRRGPSISALGKTHTRRFDADDCSARSVMLPGWPYLYRR